MATNPTRPAPLFDRHGIALPASPLRRSSSCSHLVAKLYQRNRARFASLREAVHAYPWIADIPDTDLAKLASGIDDRRTRSKRRIRLRRQTLQALFLAMHQRP
jgi:hypothetical protein